MGDDRFKDRVVLIVGWGMSGRAAAEAMHARGARVWATDRKRKEEIDEETLPSWLEEVFWGGHDLSSLPPEGWVVVSPGVPSDIPLLMEARNRGLQVMGEVELAARLGNAPILGVTGTNGKSTVVTMLGAILREAGHRVTVAGNVGLPLVSVYPQMSVEEIAVVELSSYQLEDLESMNLRGAVILNIKPDHLGRHGEFDRYKEAKARILDRLASDGFAVLNRDDEVVASLASRVKGDLWEVSTSGRVPRGGYLSSTGELRLTGTPDEGMFLHREDLHLPGEHNVLNALSSAVTAVVYGATRAAVSAALSAFRGLPHRIEPVGSVGGVELVNDSKSTNVESTRAAVRSVPAPVVLIAGGKDKGLSFDGLVSDLSGVVEALVLMGETKERMARELASVAPTIMVGGLAEALDAAVRLARGRGTVLFSPAASSFDQFRDFVDRGEAFRRACRELPGFQAVGNGRGC